MQANFWLRSLQEHGYKIEIYIVDQKNYFLNYELNLIMNRKIQ